MGGVYFVENFGMIGGVLRLPLSTVPECLYGRGVAGLDEVCGVA